MISIQPKPRATHAAGVKKRMQLSQFATAIIARLKENGKIRTAETYTAALASFMRFRNGRALLFSQITPALMEDYQHWLLARGLALNSVSFYMRILRAIYNRAVAAGATADGRPFRNVYTGVAKTVKRALPLASVRRLAAYDGDLAPSVAYARDMFMLSLFLRGMSFVDMAYLKKSDLKNGYITYRRRKTGQLLSIAWTPEMQKILAKYPANPTNFLLPIITDGAADPRRSYLNRAYAINRALKKLASLLGINTPLTLYVARHTWASVAKASGVPISVISEGMGHDSETTTQIYLASLDSAIVDKANATVLKSILS